MILRRIDYLIARKILRDERLKDSMHREGRRALMTSYGHGTARHGN